MIEEFKKSEVDENGFVTYTTTVFKGALPEQGTEWWTENEWEKHRKYVEELKATGEYLKQVEVSITLKHIDRYDSISRPIEGLVSHRIYFLDNDEYDERI